MINTDKSISKLNGLHIVSVYKNRTSSLNVLNCNTYISKLSLSYCLLYVLAMKLSLSHCVLYVLAMKLSLSHCLLYVLAMKLTLPI